MVSAGHRRVAEMRRTRSAMVARLAVLALAAGLAGCLVETVEEPANEAEAALGLVEGGDEEAGSAAAAEAAALEEVEADGLQLPALHSAPTKGEDVSGDPSPDPWDP